MMSTFIHAFLHYQFLQYAMLACLLAGIGCGIMGTYVYTQRISFLAGGIAHSVLAGMGVAYFLGGQPIIGAIIAALIAATGIAWINLRYKQQQEILIAMFWSAGMAIGIIFIAKMPNYNVDLMGYLFGNILLVSRDNILLMLILDIAIILIVGLYYQRFLICAFDQEFARLRGLSVERLYILLMCLIALTVVLLVQVVGMILMLALLTLPAATAAQYANSISKIMLLAILLSIISSVLGLAIAFQTNLPAGATIVLTACVGYLGSIGINALRTGNQ